MRVVNSSEGGTPGVAVSAANSGGASGDAFSVVTRFIGTTIDYSDTAAAHGTKSQRHVTAAGAAGGGYVQWNLGTALAQWQYRVAINPDAHPAADTRIAAFYGGGSLRASLWMTSTGALRWKNAAGTTIQTTTNTLTVASWARIEGTVRGHASLGAVETRLYKTLDSSVATETQISAASQALGGTIDSVLFGNSTSVEVAFYLDDLGVDDVGYLGPPQLTVPASLYVPPVWSLPYGVIPEQDPVPTTGQLWPRGIQ